MGIEAYQKITRNVAEADPWNAEVQAFSVVLVGLRKLKEEKVSAVERTKALFKNDYLWSILISQLQEDNHPYPADLKKNLLGLGATSRRISQKLLAGEEGDLGLLIEINESILAGLEAQRRLQKDNGQDMASSDTNRVSALYDPQDQTQA